MEIAGFIICVGGEILFRTEGNSPVGEPMQDTDIVNGLEEEGSSISAETKWIGDVQDGDYFLLCSKSIVEKVTDEDIRLLVGQNDKANFDPAGSFKTMTFGKDTGQLFHVFDKSKCGYTEKGHKQRNQRNQETSCGDCESNHYPCDDYRWTYDFVFLFPERPDIRSRIEI